MTATHLPCTHAKKGAKTKTFKLLVRNLEAAAMKIQLKAENKTAAIKYCKARWPEAAIEIIKWLLFGAFFLVVFFASFFGAVVTWHEAGAMRPNYSCVLSLEEALHMMYQGKENAAKLAERAGMHKTDLQRVFKDFVAMRPLDPDVWQKDIEMSWPYITWGAFTCRLQILRLHALSVSQ